MNWETISASSEIVGVIAVVASVIYLATQIKNQTTESRLVATRELAEKRSEMMKFVGGRRSYGGNLSTSHSRL
jgi:hypothetical protein